MSKEEKDSSSRKAWMWGVLGALLVAILVGVFGTILFTGNIKEIVDSRSLTNSAMSVQDYMSAYSGIASVVGNYINSIVAIITLALLYVTIKESRISRKRYEDEGKKFDDKVKKMNREQVIGEAIRSIKAIQERIDALNYGREKGISVLRSIYRKLNSEDFGKGNGNSRHDSNIHFEYELIMPAVTRIINDTSSVLRKVSEEGQGSDVLIYLTDDILVVIGLFGLYVGSDTEVQSKLKASGFWCSDVILQESNKLYEHADRLDIFQNEIFLNYFISDLKRASAILL